jgi:hypothetical protein
VIWKEKVGEKMKGAEREERGTEWRGGTRLQSCGQKKGAGQRVIQTMGWLW